MPRLTPLSLKFKAKLKKIKKSLEYPGPLQNKDFQSNKGELQILLRFRVFMFTIPGNS